ncbi:hypothetical protein ES708_26695 [subsurface metagenome]
MAQGRAEKAAKREKDALSSELQSTKSRLDAIEREVNETRLAEARDDPAQLRLYQREQTISKREREAANKETDLAGREEQVKTDRADVDRDKGVVSIAYVAAKHGLEVEVLEKLGISDSDTLEKVAVELAAAKTKEGGEGAGGEEGGEGEGFVPDSGATTGGFVQHFEKPPLKEIARLKDLMGNVTINCC